jgi:hypothetical protein
MQKMEITEILKNMQCELHAPKNQYNEFGKYKYRSLEDIAEALKPLEKKYNAAVLLSDEVVEVGGRVYVKATATLLPAEEGVTGRIQTTAFAREEETKKGMDAAQITGSASSYARKYALNGMFLIDDVKDPDATNKHGKEDAPAPPPTKEQLIEKAQKCKSRKELASLYHSLTEPIQSEVRDAFNEIREKLN